VRIPDDWPSALRSRQGRTIAAIGLVGLALLASCDRSANGDQQATATSTTAPTTTTVDPAKDAALAGYRAYWDAYLAAADPMDPTSPALAQTATGPALESVQRSFLALRSAGKVIRGKLDLAPQVTDLEGTLATVEDCYADDTGVYEVSTGKREDTPTGQRHSVTATLRMEGEVWKVERLEDGGLGCTAG
jgi:hypothetical protein